VSYPHPQPFHPAPAPAPGGLRGWFKNASGGLLAFLSITTVIVCCVTPIVFCLFNGVFELSTYVDENPTVEITKCDINNDEIGGIFRGRATVEFTIEHNGAYSRSLRVEVEIRNSEGVAVGTGSDNVFGLEPDVVEPGKASVYSLTGPGVTCHVTGVS
jgi:hypothetical protein